ncbi:hypothetical protein AB4Z46_10100 [Variovorax sp. M-6]|uniref:hypothetical protein n=1 Tax=Variovorax sp. M-6 TaxID=3233041 RepID=UPI003F9845B9
MKAPLFLGTLNRIRSRLQRLVGWPTRAVTSVPPGPLAPFPRVAAPRPIPSTPQAPTPSAAPMRAVVAAARPAPAAFPVPAAAQPSAPARTMRSLEEVRADLARLRQSAKERHARIVAPVRRDTSFEPTDFMDFAKPAEAPEESFEATAFLDFTTLKPRPGG